MRRPTRFAVAVVLGLVLAACGGARQPAKPGPEFWQNCFAPERCGAVAHAVAGTPVMLPSLRSLTMLDGYFVPTRRAPTAGMNVGSIQYMDQATRRQFTLSIYKSPTVICRSNGYEHVIRTPGG